MEVRGSHKPYIPSKSTTTQIGPPLWLLAELTYRCPLHCVFCYNPTDFAKTAVENELSTDDWLHVLREARAAGSVQCGFSGGEPLLRDDLEILVAEAHKLGFYTNLLTSGVGLNETRIAELKAGRARPHPALVPGFHQGTQRLALAHQDLRTQAEGRAPDQVERLADGVELRDPSPEHRLHRQDHRDGGRTGRRVSRTRQQPVLLVGAGQSRPAVADARATAARRAHHQRIPRQARRQDPHVLRRARLLRNAPEETA